MLLINKYIETPLVVDKDAEIKGYAWVFKDADQYGDSIPAGAFADALSKSDRVSMFFNHLRKGIPIGKWTNIQEDGTGLHVRGELTKGHRDYESLKAAIDHGTVSGLSVGIEIDPAHIKKTAQGRIFEKIDKVNEISVCTNPAHLDARLHQKSLEGVETIRDIENWLREACDFSKSEAKDLIALVKSAVRWDAERESEVNKYDSLIHAISASTRSFKNV